ncbi:MAG: hypothetical protein DLM73_16715 [Chthoniobacterales bacterium]|nr:MAG: hypothetical protein DLM73_16715 [Chthoniobacterales bacterium]
MRRITAAAAVMAIACTLTNLRGAEQKRIDVSAVITRADAEAALGEPVKEPQPRNGEGADGYYSRCNYYSQNPGKSLVLRVRQAAAGQLEPKQQLDALSAGNPRIKPLSGFGDKASLLSGGGSREFMLYVVKGNAFITVGIGGIDDEKAALEKTKTLARKILKQL